MNNGENDETLLFLKLFIEPQNILVIHVVEPEGVHSLLKADWFFFLWPIMRNLMFVDVNRGQQDKVEFGYTMVGVIIPLEFRECI